MTSIGFAVHERGYSGHSPFSCPNINDIYAQDVKIVLKYFWIFSLNKFKVTKIILTLFSTLLIPSGTSVCLLYQRNIMHDTGNLWALDFCFMHLLLMKTDYYLLGLAVTVKILKGKLLASYHEW